MGTSELGKLESANLRKAWPHEAHDFTPWLAENLDRLSEAIGLDLELEGYEVQVGPYRADIVANDPSDGTRVLIENQLEDANHQHLGQVLAYLAGVEAKVVVWIAKEFDEQQRSAIRWLNDHTEDPFAFFAIRLRVVRIGESPLAPVFEVLERPNEWDRRVQESTRTGELTALGQFRRNFWNHVASKYPSEVRRDYAAGYVRHHVEGVELAITLYLAQREVGVFFFDKRGESEKNQQARIRPYRKALEKELGEKPRDKWGTTILAMNTTDKANWDRAADWLHERRKTYEQVLRETST